MAYSLCLLLALAAQISADHLIIPPLDISKNTESIGLIFIIGTDIEPSEYSPLCKQIQSLSSQPLFIAIPEFIQNIPTLDELVVLLPSILKELQLKGLKNNSSVFMTGNVICEQLSFCCGLHVHFYHFIYC